MAENIRHNVGSALTRIEFTDDDGITLGFLKINLTDIRLAERLNAVSRFFQEYKYDGEADGYIADLDRCLREKFSFVLGYDCQETLFSVLSPTTLMEDGDMFANEILKKISEVLAANIKKKAEARAAAVAKYTSRYDRV